MKYFTLLPLVAIVACGDQAPQSNALQVQQDERDGKIYFEGRAGSDVTEADIRGLLLGDGCKEQGLELTQLTLTPQTDGTSDVSAVCS